MSKRVLTLIVTLIPLAIIVLAALPVRGEEHKAEPEKQTWPSRTPTPAGGPTDPPPPTEDGGGNGNGDGNTATPAPTTDGQPIATPTGVIVTSIVLTPEGGYLPTAEPCAMTPTIQTRGQVNVRQGPGIDYPTMGQLLYLEVRPIIGRAAFAPWWLIQLADESQGWVADQAIAVQGYTGAVPFVEPPAINGNTPTPGAPWNPTPNPICTPEPTATPTNTATSAAVVPAQPASPSPLPPTNTPLPVATETSVRATETPTSPVVTVAPSATSFPTAVPLESEGNGNGSGSMLLYAGMGLLVVGVAAAALRLRSRPTETG